MRADEDGAVDVDALIDQLRQRVEERRAAGEYPADLEERLDAHFRSIEGHRRSAYDFSVLDEHLGKLRQTSSFSQDSISTDSRVSGGAAFHRAVAKMVSRQVAGILEQLQTFADLAVAVGEELAGAVRNPRSHRHDDLEGAVRLLQDQAAALSTIASDPLGSLAGLEGRVARVEQVTDRALFRPWFTSSRFEDELRGTTEELRDRYRDLASVFRDCSPVVDLGCGRGEFLELLAEIDVEATGVEVDPRLVADLRERHLPVVLDDAVSRLRKTEDASLGGVALIQVIEHLTPQDTVDLIPLLAEKLRRGGRAVVETVNPQSLYVYARAFYADPTHTNPVHPAYLTFLFQESGFAEVDIEWRSPPPAAEALVTAPAEGPVAEAFNENVKRLNQLLFGPQDYALIARR